MRFKWVLILMTVMFIIGFCSKKTTAREGCVTENTEITEIVDTVVVDSLMVIQ